MPERLYTLHGSQLQHELDPETWMEWYISNNRIIIQADIPDGKLVCVFTGIDKTGQDPPQVYEVRKIITRPGGWVEEEAWSLRTQQEAKACFDLHYAEAVAA